MTDDFVRLACNASHIESGSESQGAIGYNGGCSAFLVPSPCGSIWSAVLRGLHRDGMGMEDKAAETRRSQGSTETTAAASRGGPSQFALLTAVLDSIPCAVFLLDEGGRIEFANAEARRARASERVRVDARGRLLGWGDSEGPNLGQQVRTGCYQNFRLTLSGARGPVIAYLLPYAKSTRSGGGLVLVPSTTPVRTTQWLVSERGLTASEAAIALAVARGRAPSEIAGERGASIGTVRNQLKRAMAKLGVHRQAELAAELALASGPFASLILT